MKQASALLFLGLMIVAGFAGCLGGDSGSPASDDAQSKKLSGAQKARSVFEGSYRFDGGYSYTLAEGPFPFKTPFATGELVAIPSKVVPTNPNGRIVMGLWLPMVPDGTKVPVIVDAGPYYDTNNDQFVTKPAGRMGKMLIENFVPHGYAVAQLAVRGTSDHGGCMDLMGIAEQTDLSTAIDWLGTQPWSNGNVAMIGRSYDGSTPWEVAAQGNTHLKTIVPISGLSDFFGLMTYNGTSESRASGLIHGLYYTFGFASNERSAENKAANAVCPEALRGFATAAYSTVVGDRFLSPAGGPAATVNDYYYVRDFKKFAAQKWHGSIFMIHGLQDWNVEPHMGVPVADNFERAGYTVKQLYGQWGHSYPDRPSEHARIPCGAANDRWDFAEILLHWFDHELKGLTTVDTGPAVQVLSAGECRWHNEEHFPPRDANWTTLHLSAGGKLSKEPGAAGSAPLTPVSAVGGAGSQFRSLPGYSAEFALGPLESDLRFSGLPRVHVTVTPNTPSGHVSAFLYDVDDKGVEKRVGVTQMNLLYADGGDVAKPFAPGLPLLVKMQLEPLDVLVPAGHKLVLRLWEATYEDHIATIPPGVVTLNYGGSTKSVLELPVIERGEDAFFTPPQPPAGNTPKPAATPTSAPTPE